MAGRQWIPGRANAVSIAGWLGCSELGAQHALHEVYPTRADLAYSTTSKCPACAAGNPKLLHARIRLDVKFGGLTT